MAYDLNMQLNLQAPTSGNVASVKKVIETGLKDIKIGGFDAKGFAKANSEVENLKKNLNKGEKSAKSFFDAVAGKTVSYASYAAASTAVLKLTGAISQATRESIKYEAELIKISQVTGDSINRTKAYAKELIKISKTYNVNISKIAQLTRTLAQTGLSFRDAAKGAELLAKTSLLASFEELTSTTEGLIAVMQTFNITVTQSARVLEEINIVSKRFAVESGDIVEAIRRTGGAFSAAGGNVEELIALFTSVRSTSRESAETIATGFRTIFGRLQRPKTIEYFKQLGIQLETAEGQFVGPFKAIEELSKGLDRLGITAGSVRFAEVVEQIGGIRQLSKVVPLLNQFAKAQNALDLQNEASAESSKDVEKAQQGLGYQLGVLQKEFVGLVQEISSSSSFQFLAKTFIAMAKAVIDLTSAFKPLLPILTVLTTFKIGKGLGTLLSGKFNLKGISDASSVAKTAEGFARGGLVPGSGNSDTVPAMLTPGEFVIRKSAVQAFGASNLGRINKYEAGGKILTKDLRTTNDNYSGRITLLKRIRNTPNWQDTDKTYINYDIVEVDPNEEKDKKLRQRYLNNRILDERLHKGEAFEAIVSKKYDLPLRRDRFDSLDFTFGEAKSDKNYGNKLTGVRYLSILAKTLNSHSDYLDKFTPEYDEINPSPRNITLFIDKYRNKTSAELKKIFKESDKRRGQNIRYRALASGGIVEGFAPNLTVRSRSGYGDVGRKKQYLAQLIEHLQEQGGNLSPDMQKKLNSLLARQESMTSSRTRRFSGRMGFSSGGAVGTDTVPALLTPGEFVINQKSAQAYGYANLKRINKYAKGGIVQRFNNGGIADDVKRGTGTIQYTVERFQEEINKVLAPLGELGEKIKKKYAVRETTEEMKSQSPNIRGGISTGRRSVIYATPGTATQSTAAHEVGHAVDYELTTQTTDPNTGQFVRKQAASETKNTFQNKLVEAAKKQLKLELEAQGVSKEHLKYRLKNTEIFADMFQKSDQAVRDILASTTDAKEGMKALAKLMTEQPDKYSRLFGDIQDKITTLRRAQGTIRVRAAAGKVNAANSLSAKTANEKTVTSKTVKRDFETSGAGEITKQIAEQSRELKALQKQHEEAMNTSIAAAENLNTLDRELRIGKHKRADVEHKRVELAQKAAKAEAEALETLEELEKLTKERSNLIERAQKMKSQKTAALTSGTQGSFKEFSENASQVNQPLNKVKKTSEEVAASHKKLSINSAQLVFGFTAATQGLKAFGVKLNDAALRSGTGSIASLGAATDVTKTLSDSKNIRASGIALRKFSRKLPIKGLDSLGKTISKNGVAIAKTFAKLTKALNVLTAIDIAGTLLDALFSVDYEKQKNAAIEAGDADAAAAAATNEYSQSIFRSVPIVGGFAAALQRVIPGLSLAGTVIGKLVASTAALQAGLTALKNNLKISNDNISNAARRGDFAEVDQISKQQIQLLNSQLLSAEKTKGQARSSIGSIGKLFGGDLKQVQSSFEILGQQYEELSSIFVNQIKASGGLISGSATELIKNGSSLEDALSITKDRYGAAFNQLLGSVELNAKGLEKAYNAQAEQNKQLQKQIETARQNLADAKINQTRAIFGAKKISAAKVAEAESTLKELESKQQMALAHEQEIANLQMLTKNQEALTKQRQIEAERLRTIIMLNRGLEDSQRVIQGILDKFENISESFNIAGTGKLSTEERLAGTGISTRTLRMNSEDIIKDSAAFDEVLQSIDRTAAAQGLGNAPKEFLQRTQKELNSIDFLEKQIRDGAIDLATVLQQANEDVKTSVPGAGDSKTLATAIKDRLTTALGNNISPELDAALTKYSQALIDEKDPTIAADKVKSELSEQERKMIEEQLENVKQIAEQRNTLTEYEIAAYQKAIDNFQKMNDIQRSFESQITNLRKSSADFFDVDNTFRGRRRSTRRAFDFASGLASSEEARSQVSRDAFLDAAHEVDALKLANQNATTATHNLTMAAQAHADQIANQINAENEKLNAMREEATAHRDLTQSLRDAQGDLATEFAFGSDDQRTDLLRSSLATQMAVSQGSFAGFSGDMRGQVASFLDRFSDIQLPGAGGRTGAEIKGELGARELARTGLIRPSQIRDVADKMAKKAVPVDERMKQQIETQETKLAMLIEEERRMKEQVFQKDLEIQKMYQESVNNQVKAINELIQKLGVNLGTDEANALKTEQDKGFKKEADRARARASLVKQEQKKQQKINALNQQNQSLEKEAQELRNDAKNIRTLQERLKEAKEMPIRAAGYAGSQNNLNAKRNKAIVEIQRELLNALKAASNKIETDKAFVGGREDVEKQRGLSIPDRSVQALLALEQAARFREKKIKDNQNRIGGDLKPLTPGEGDPNWTQSVRKKLESLPQQIVPRRTNNTSQQQEVSNVEIAGSLNTSLDITGLGAMLSGELSAIVYEKISDKFRELAQNIKGATDTDGIQRAVLDAATSNENSININNSK